MPLLLGFILGVALTIAGAYEYDSTTGRTANGLSAASTGAPMVNWGVVADHWQHLQTDLRTNAAVLERKLKEHS